MTARAHRLGWLFGSVLLFAVLGELGARVFFGNAALQELFQFDPGDGRCVALRLNQQVLYTGWLVRIPAIEQEVNALGFRGRPIPTRRSASPRIAVVGDSFTFGVGVGVNDTIPAQLERMIVTETGRDVEVLNFGVPGLNVEEVVSQFERFANRWAPDIVLYLVWANDLDHGLCGGSGGLLAADGWAVRMVRTSRFARLLYVAWFIVKEHGVERWRLDHDPGAVDRFMKAARRLASIANEKHARLGLVTLGWPVREAKREALARRLAAADIPVLDVSGMASNPRNRMRIEAHLTPEGCHSVAGAIAQWLQSDDSLRSALAHAGSS